MKTVDVDRKSWVFNLAIQNDYLRKKYNYGYPITICELRKYVIIEAVKLAWLWFWIGVGATALTALAVGVVISLVSFPYYLFTNWDIRWTIPFANNMGTAATFGFGIWVLILFLAMVKGVAVSYRSLKGKYKAPKKPGLIKEMYLSWRDKYCAKINVV